MIQRFATQIGSFDEYAQVFYQFWLARKIVYRLGADTILVFTLLRA
jgi:hypothetical protein